MIDLIDLGDAQQLLQEANAEGGSVTLHPRHIKALCAAISREKIPIPSGLEDFGMEAHGDEDNALLDTEGGQWSVAMIDSVPEHADFKDPSPWSSIAMGQYLAALHNQNRKR